ncbi:hypothetical protein JL720_6629 [Aureococcus anophagefferens]|nr:hypothetical protein JL720_6629 [Aureococcus anophagefferens]
MGASLGAGLIIVIPGLFGTSLGLANSAVEARVMKLVTYFGVGIGIFGTIDERAQELDAGRRGGRELEVDWRERGHRTACKKIRDERAAEAARAEAPTPPPSPPEEVVFYGPAPRSHADEVRARIAAEHEAARARREANPEPEPVSARN